MGSAHLDHAPARIIILCGIRAFLHGAGAVLLGTLPQELGWDAFRAGVFLAQVGIGSALGALTMATLGDRLGRRRAYGFYFLLLALSGVLLAESTNFIILSVVAISGVLATDVLEGGAFIVLEQTVLWTSANRGSRRPRLLGVYFALSTIVGALGALSVRYLPDLLDGLASGEAVRHSFFIFLPLATIAAVLAFSLPEEVEASAEPDDSETREEQKGPAVKSPLRRLAWLFGLDAFGGGLVVQTFLAYWFQRRFGVSISVLGPLFSLLGLAQALSIWVSSLAGERFGHLRIMVQTHLFANLLLLLLPFVANAYVAAFILVVRGFMGNMDVPIRQAYVASLVPAEERMAAIGFTTTVRYTARPFGTAFTGFAQTVWLGLPFFAATTIRTLYNVLIWRWLKDKDIERSWERSDRHA